MRKQNLFNGIYKDKTVMITGHTGFKGSWLSLWLHKLGAKVIGYSIEPPTYPNHFDILKLHNKIISIHGNLNDINFLNETIKKYKPDMIYHFAALALVRKSYKNPLQAFETNIMGTVNLFEVVKNFGNIKAIINITTDKCYENKEWCWGYREIDPVGGYDPYSASKACSEIVTSAYRSSYFNPDMYRAEHNTLIASCRAGNVIGGGDWGEDRLIPDIVRSISQNNKIIIRSPSAIRPWQYILDCLRGYLMLGQKLLAGKKNFAQAWNFGSISDSNLSVIDVVKYLKNINNFWMKINYEIKEDDTLHESMSLKLDCSKVVAKLKWWPIMRIEDTFLKTAEWYQAYYEKQECISEKLLDEYCNMLE